MDFFELPKAYDPKETDRKWVHFWEENQFFKVDPHSKKPPFSLVIPPPNVTGVLHIGHALGSTLQDVLTRWKRMSGFEALFLPGTDHAGIATQTVVEQHLIATQNKRRSDFSREEFIKIVWEWKEKHGRHILNQLKQLGCSCDFSRERFTLDEGCNRAVRTMFKHLYDEGMIYQGNYLVNWDPVTETALADDEVEHEERAGHLWFFKYPLADKSGFVRIATTRPETMLGDTAIAVSPDDERYHHLIGKRVLLPLMNREIPILADRHVNPEFGTGMVKITPAHDPNDYRIGIDHNLEMINILTPSGEINEAGGPFSGMNREEARQAVIAQMKKLGFFEKAEPHTSRVGISYRSKSVIEPYLSKQWFIKMTPFIPSLKEAIDQDEVTLHPSSWKNTYFHWVNNLRDWCISRQLWWGHRIPIWYHKDDPEKMICYDGPGDPPEVKAAPQDWEQESDVLDTWFSSALWPLSTLGWPDKTPDFEKFYPTTVLETGNDILFFWVARMIMMGKYATGHPPFTETFLHGLIFGKSYWREDPKGGITYITGEEKKSYDEGKPLPSDVHSKWEKVSKSKGNVIDPLEMIEVYGTDALRMTLCSLANQSPQIDLDKRRFEEFKHFANKVWNGARFVFMNLEGLTSEELATGISPAELSLEDRWILSVMNGLNEGVDGHLTHYRFDQAAKLAYDFFWNEFCALYLEISKQSLAGTRRIAKQKLLVILLLNSIRLLHPMAPFITEELFQLLKKRFPFLKPTASDPYTQDVVEALLSPACAVAPYPKVVCKKDIQPVIEEQFALLQQIVYAVRNIRGEMKIPPHLKTDLYLIGNHEGLDKQLHIIRSLVKVEKIELTSQAPPLACSATARAGNLTLLVPLPPELAAQERVRLQKALEKRGQMIEKSEKLLGNPNFLEKAQPKLIEEQKIALKEAIATAKELQEKLDGLTPQ